MKITENLIILLHYGWLAFAFLLISYGIVLFYIRWKEYKYRLKVFNKVELPNLAFAFLLFSYGIVLFHIWCNEIF